MFDIIDVRCNREVHEFSQFLSIKNFRKGSHFLFQLNVHNMLNTYIYNQLPPTCFGVCYIILSETIALLVQKLNVFAMQTTKHVGGNRR